MNYTALARKAISPGGCGYAPASSSNPRDKAQASFPAARASAACGVDPPYDVFDVGFLHGEVEHFRLI
jgi:hypothetical protein